MEALQVNIRRWESAGPEGAAPVPRGEDGPVPRASPADELLLCRLLDGDEEAFAALVSRHHRSLVRLARVFVASPSVADEVVQETWLAVVNGLSGFRGQSSLKTWIFRILANRARSRGVRESRSTPFSALGDADPGEAAVDADCFRSDGSWADPPHHRPELSPERVSMDRQALERLEAALLELPERQRAVVTLRDVEGLDAAEVCDVLGVSETNLRVLLHRGRTKLRRVLVDHDPGR